MRTLLLLARDREEGGEREEFSRGDMRGGPG